MTYVVSERNPQEVSFGKEKVAGEKGELLKISPSRVLLVV